MNLYQAIFERKSVRKFQMEKIAPDVLESIWSYYKECQGLFSGIETEIQIIDNVEKRERLGFVPTKAPYYLLLYTQENEKASMNAGCLMEQLALYLCTKGIGTCYLGSAVVRPKYKTKNNKKLAMVLAFGKGRESIIRKKAEARRLELSTLCAYKEIPRQWMNQLLEAARLAPSSMNSQPWRFLVYDNRIHVFLRKRRYSLGGVFDDFNFGIMFSHMLIVAEELWLDIDLVRLDDISQRSFTNCEYVLSVILNS